MDKLIVILGPTATGKTHIAVNIASKYKGEIISADSRQIYKGMNIGTGKDLDEYNHNNKIIPYHLIDILNPEKNYSVFQFKNDFFKSYDIINKNNNLPILCGGTGFYIESVLLNYDMPHVGPDEILRKDYDKKDIASKHQNAHSQRIEQEFNFRLWKSIISEFPAIRLTNLESIFPGPTSIK